MSDRDDSLDRNEWLKVIICGLCLGSILGYNLYCIRCYLCGIEQLFPVFLLHAVI